MTKTTPASMHIPGLDARKLLVFLNFKDQALKANTGLDLIKAKRLLSNYQHPSVSETLQPYEAAVYVLTN